MRSIGCTLLLSLLLPGQLSAQEGPRVFRFEQALPALSCVCPPGEVLANPPVDPAMILRPRTRYRPQMRLLRPSPQVQPAFRNLACRPVRPSAWLDSLQTRRRRFSRLLFHNRRRSLAPLRF